MKDLGEMSQVHRIMGSGVISRRRPQAKCHFTSRGWLAENGKLDAQDRVVFEIGDVGPFDELPKALTSALESRAAGRTHHEKVPAACTAGTSPPQRGGGDMRIAPTTAVAIADAALKRARSSCHIGQRTINP